MKRLIVICEGQSEVNFIKELLYKSFITIGISLEARTIPTGKNKYGGFAKGESWFIQNICYHLWQKYTQITQNEVKEIINEIIGFNDNVYRMLFDKFSSTQKTALKIIATSQNQKILSQENTMNFAISKQSLVSAIKSLLEQEIISKNENSYEINDILFEIWIKKL